MMEHWWIHWQIGKLRQKELLSAAAHGRVLRKIQAGRAGQSPEQSPEPPAEAGRAVPILRKPIRSL